MIMEYERTGCDRLLQEITEQDAIPYKTVRNILRCGITKTCSRDWAAECNDVADPHADEDHPAENGMARNNDMM